MANRAMGRIRQAAWKFLLSHLPPSVQVSSMERGPADNRLERARSVGWEKRETKTAQDRAVFAAFEKASAFAAGGPAGTQRNQKQSIRQARSQRASVD